jgi:hypothetical protein
VQYLELVCQCYLHFLPTAWFISLIYDFHEPGVSSSLGHRVPAAVNISRRHAASIFLSKTKVYGYNLVHGVRTRQPSRAKKSALRNSDLFAQSFSL